MDGYLSKPVDKEKLFYTIGKMTDKAAKLRAGAGQAAPLTAAPRLGNKNEQGYLADIIKYIEQNKDDKEFLDNILRGFIHETPVRMGRLAQAVSEENFEQIAKAAHSMTGLAGSVRIYSAATYAKEIEKAARSHLLAEVLSCYELLKQQMEKISGYLKDETMSEP